MHYNVDMLWITSLFVKFLCWFIKTSRLGNGYTWPGHLVNKLFPAVWNSPLLHFKRGVILISGTNGKTTTSKLLTHLLLQNGNSVTHNQTGANMLSGILTSILLTTDFWGRTISDYAVLEVDELTLPLLLKRLHPQYLILTNLSRDQLDRCGEIDSIFAKWLKSFKELTDTCLLMSSDFAYRDEIFSIYKGDLLEFDSSPDFMKYTSLIGRFNALNVNAAVLAAQKIGIAKSNLQEYLSSFAPAFGRGEKIMFEDKSLFIFLAKNPASFNNNLQMLQDKDFSYEALLFILNDNIPDGRDVSWIYDIEPILLAEVCKGKNIYISGTRSLDMQIRLSYAGVKITEDLGDLSLSILANLPEKNIVVLPNYSAMLSLRKLVTGKNIL